MTTNLIVKVEITDTFGGEANYNWVKRFELKGLEDKSDLAIVRAVKKEIGWNGYRCKKENYDDMIRLTPYGLLQTCFIEFHAYGSAS